jgi:uncharacterized NAD(P)/FAD-binding protein YdhS
MHVVVVGGGPAAVYFLRWMDALIVRRRPPVLPSITVIERGPRFGVGWVYSDRTVLPIHSLAANELRSRIDKGEELETRLHKAVASMKGQGAEVQLRPNSEVVDIVRDGRLGYSVQLDSGDWLRADSVVLCAGHWNGRSVFDALPGGMTSPWPAVDLQSRLLPGSSALFIGSSHTAVDAALSVAQGYGSYHKAGDRVVYRASGARPPRMTLASRGGFLPRVSGFGITTNEGEPDGPLKYRRSLTEERLKELYSRGQGWIRFAQMFDLLLGESPFAAARHPRPPDQLADLAEADRTLRRLAAQLSRVDGTRLFRLDLARAARSVREKQYIPWQSVLWDKADLFRAYFHALPGEDRRLVDAHHTLLLAFMRPLNFRNSSMLAALMDAGLVELVRLGARHHIEPGPDSRSTVLRMERRDGATWTRTFDTAVNCTGQIKHLDQATDPLLNRLQRRGLIQPTIIPFHDPGAADAPPGREQIIEIAGRPHYLPGGIHLNPHTMEVIPAGSTARSYRGRGARLFVLGPAMLGQYPISEGLHALYKVAEFVAQELLQDLAHLPEARPGAA